MTIGEIWERLRQLEKLARISDNYQSRAELRVEIRRLIEDIERYQRNAGLRP